MDVALTGQVILVEGVLGKIKDKDKFIGHTIHTNVIHGICFKQWLEYPNHRQKNKNKNHTYNDID